MCRQSANLMAHFYIGIVLRGVTEHVALNKSSLLLMIILQNTQILQPMFVER
jgi:hypothetical protein